MYGEHEHDKRTQKRQLSGDTEEKPRCIMMVTDYRYILQLGLSLQHSGKKNINISKLPVNLTRT